MEVNLTHFIYKIQILLDLSLEPLCEETKFLIIKKIGKIATFSNTELNKQ